MMQTTSKLFLSCLFCLTLSLLNGCGYLYAQSDAEADNAKRFQDIKAKAESGDIEAQCWLAICYEIGLHGCDIDKLKAKEWFSKVAENSNEKLATVQYSKAICYANGYGIAKTKDLARSVELYRQAAEQGFAPAQCNLGLCYYKAEGIRRNLDEAFQWLKKSSEQDYPFAHIALSSCYDNGHGVGVDRAQGRLLRLKAVDQRLPEAFYAQGITLMGMQSNSTEADAYMRRAAERGHAGGQYAMGSKYYYVFGNTTEAVKWWRKAAEQGHTGAKNKLAQLGY